MGVIGLYRLFSKNAQAAGSSTTTAAATAASDKGGAEEGEDKNEKHPMLDMADIARRAVPRKKSFLYTRAGDKGTSQVRFKIK